MSFIDKAEQNLIHVYNRFPVVFDRGEGVFLYDENDKEYLDFASGIGVCALGYGNEKIGNAIKAQTDLLLHTSNLFYNAPAANAAEKLVKTTGLNKAFFTNSGAEAVEGALKVAKRYAYDKSEAKKNGDYSEGYEVIAMNNSFHGRTKGALEITGTESYRKPFGPDISDVKFAEFNNLDSVKELVTDKTCAIVVECVQGEGGVTPADEDFIKGIRALCDEKDILMICDEIQCGMGRTGKMFAYEHFGIKPDIVTCAKALGCGVPVGAFVCGEKCMDTLVPGDHGTTYGGNPLVTSVVSAVFDIYEDEKIVEHAKEMGDYLASELDKLVDEFDSVKKRKGLGLMQGLELDVPVAEITNKAIEEGLVVISAGGNVLRMLPPLIINEKNVKNMIDILKKIL